MPPSWCPAAGPVDATDPAASVASVASRSAVRSDSVRTAGAHRIAAPALSSAPPPSAANSGRSAASSRASDPESTARVSAWLAPFPVRRSNVNCSRTRTTSSAPCSAPAPGPGAARGASGSCNARKGAGDAVTKRFRSDHGACAALAPLSAWVLQPAPFRHVHFSSFALAWPAALHPSCRPPTYRPFAPPAASARETSSVARRRASVGHVAHRRSSRRQDRRTAGPQDRVRSPSRAEQVGRVIERRTDTDGGGRLPARRVLRCRSRGEACSRCHASS